MVKKKRRLYQCEECELLYRDSSLAKKCKEFCRKNKACSLDIIKYSVKVKK